MSQHGCPERLSNRSKGFQEEGGSQATMELLVETLTGTAFEMTVSPSDTIFAIKSKIYRVEGIPIAAQHLVYNLQELADSVCVGELRMGAGARLRLVLGMRGGPVSTRRLPPPAPATEPWPHIERLLDSNRDELELGGGGCKVTVLVFRDGERVNMLRVRENTDGTYSPLDTTKYSASVPCLSEAGAEPAAAAGALRENAVTMGKMLELRRRMEALSVQRAACPHHAPDDAAEMCKTRSEEALPAARELAPELCAQPYAYDADECFALPHDSNYTRYSYECGFGSRYTLLPPIGARDAADDARHTALQRRQVRGGGEEAAILEEVGEECVRDAAPLQPLHHHLGELVGGCAWRGHSASALQLRAGAPPDQLDAPFSSSTSELENLKRNSRLLPGLSRARPREHLHLSDEGLHLRRDQHHASYRTRESSQPSGAEDRLYNRREMTSQPSAAEERLYMRRETTSQPCVEDRLYSRADSSNEERLYNRREKLHKDEDRLYNRRESTLPDDRLYNRRDTTLPGEERLYNRRDTTHPDDNLYRSITQTQDIYLRHDDDRLYAPTEQDDMFRDSQNIAIEERLYMHAGDNMADTLYMDRDHVLQSLNEDHTYSRNINLKDQMYEDRLYLRRDAANDDERLYNRGGRLPDKGGEQAEIAVDKVSVAPEPAVEVKEKKIRVRCGWCKKRLSVATVHRCRCGGAWCAQHRYSEVHGCAWDYKAESRAPPSLLPPKLPKI